MDIQNTTSKGSSVVRIAPENNKQAGKVAVNGNDLMADKKTIENKIAERLEQVEEKVASKEVADQSVKQAVSEVNHFFQNEQRKIAFSLNQKTGSTIIQVKDAETDKVLRQIPAEYVVKLAEHLSELQDSQNSSGVLLKELA